MNHENTYFPYYKIHDFTYCVPIKLWDILLLKKRLSGGVIRIEERLASKDSEIGISKSEVIRLRAEA
jgi:hypothetical protein